MQSLKQQINDLLPIALSNGVSVLDFWDMTCEEIVQTIQANQQAKNNELKQQAQLDYQHAQLVACFVGALFSQNNPSMPTLYDTYPNLFEQERLQEQKERWKKFVESHNYRKKGEQQWTSN